MLNERSNGWFFSPSTLYTFVIEWQPSSIYLFLNYYSEKVFHV